MNITVKLGKAQPKQQEFLEATEKYVMFGGARGGGKSWVVREKAKRLALYWAGIKILIIRKTYTDLRENHILPISASLPPVLAPYKEKDKSFCFINGSRIKCSYFANDSDALQYQGQEYDVIFLEEATQFTEMVFNVLKACLRGANRYPKRMYLTCNPDGVGFMWVKRLFVDREYTEKEKPEEYRFIQSLITDNQKLIDNDPDYLDQLDSLPEGMRERWRYGSWDFAAGQYFREFRREIHVIEPFKIPSEWRRYRAIDYGLDGLACLWIAVDSTGKAYVYKEKCGSNLSIGEAAEAIINQTERDEEIYCTLAPPDLWNRSQESGKSRAILFGENGVHFTQTNNDREAGWLSIKELLRTNKDGEPRLQIFRNCTELIKCIPALLIDEKRPSDCKKEPHQYTHAPDALRYFAIYWHRPGEVVDNTPRRVWTADMWEDYYSAQSESEKEYIMKKYGRPR